MTYTSMQLAEAFLRTGELDDALDVLNAHLAQSPTDSDALRLRASLHMRLGNVGQALADCHSIPTPTAEDAVLQSRLYERDGDTARALSAMRDALALAPHEARYHERVVHLLSARGDWEGVLAVAQAQPPEWRWQQHMGDALAHLGRDDEARACYDAVLIALDALIAQMVQKGVFRAIKARVLLARAEIAMRQARYDDASADFSLAKRIIPDDPTIDFNLGILKAYKGDWEGALGQCQEAYGFASDAIRAHLREEVQRTPFLHPLLAVMVDEG
jgi:tetratricopeptide (TPR) repeat protein